MFPQNPSDVIKRGHGEEQNRFLHSALAAIAAEPDFAAVPTADLHNGLTALETARAHRETLYAAENEAKARLRVTFEQACDHLDEAEPRLTLHVPQAARPGEELLLHEAQGGVRGAGGGRAVRMLR